MRRADNLPPSCAVVTKSGSLNFLEPSGPVQACNGAVVFFSCFYRSVHITALCLGCGGRMFPLDSFPIETCLASYYVAHSLSICLGDSCIMLCRNLAVGL